MVNIKFASPSPLEPSLSPEAFSPTTQSTLVAETLQPQRPAKRRKRAALKIATPAVSVSTSASSSDPKSATSDDEATEEDSLVHISLSDTERSSILVPFSPTTNRRRQSCQLPPLSTSSSVPPPASASSSRRATVAEKGKAPASSFSAAQQPLLPEELYILISNPFPNILRSDTMR